MVQNQYRLDGAFNLCAWPGVLSAHLSATMWAFKTNSNDWRWIGPKCSHPHQVSQTCSHHRMDIFKSGLSKAGVKPYIFYMQSKR